MVGRRGLVEKFATTSRAPTLQRRIDVPLVERTAEARNGDGHRNQHQQE